MLSAEDAGYLDRGTELLGSTEPVLEGTQMRPRLAFSKYIHY